jgi:hypothetical protein
MTMTTSRSTVTLIMDYDLRYPDALKQAKCRYHYWGVLYTDPYLVGEHCLVLVFRTAGPLWRDWEAVRLGWILDRDLRGSEAA